MIEVKATGRGIPGKFQTGQALQKNIEVLGTPEQQYEQQLAFRMVLAILESFAVLPCQVQVTVGSTLGSTTKRGEVSFPGITAPDFVKRRIRDLEDWVENFARRFPVAKFEVNFEQTVHVD